MSDVKWQNTNLGRERREFLNARIREVRNVAWRTSRPDARNDPPAVAKARKVISDYETRFAKKIEAAHDEIVRMCDDASRMILFTDDPQVAKETVDRLLATARKRGWIA